MKLRKEVIAVSINMSFDLKDGLRAVARIQAARVSAEVTEEAQRKRREHPEAAAKKPPKPAGP